MLVNIQTLQDLLTFQPVITRNKMIDQEVVNILIELSETKALSSEIIIVALRD